MSLREGRKEGRKEGREEEASKSVTACYEILFQHLSVEKIFLRAVYVADWDQLQSLLGW